MRGIADITAELAARLSGTQKEQLAGALDLILSLTPDMREVARLEKVIKDQNIFVELAVKASDGIYPNHQGGHFIPADGQEQVAAFKLAASRKCSWRAYGVYPSGVRTCTLGEYCRQDGASVSNTPNVKEGVSCRKTVGNGDCTYNIMLPYYVRTCGDADVAPEPKTVNIDKCLLREVLDLWEQGIKTTSVCCGHGKLVHRHISVMPESVDKMLALGYRPQRFMADKQGASFFPQTLAVFHLDIDKGFNWWTEQPLNKEATSQEVGKPHVLPVNAETLPSINAELASRNLEVAMLQDRWEVVRKDTKKCVIGRGYHIGLRLLPDVEQGYEAVYLETL